MKMLRRILAPHLKIACELNVSSKSNVETILYINNSRKPHPLPPTRAKCTPTHLQGVSVDFGFVHVSSCCTLGNQGSFRAIQQVLDLFQSVIVLFELLLEAVNHIFLLLYSSCHDLPAIRDFLTKHFNWVQAFCDVCTITRVTKRCCGCHEELKHGCVVEYIFLESLNKIKTFIG